MDSVCIWAVAVVEGPSPRGVRAKSGWKGLKCLEEWLYMLSFLGIICVRAGWMAVVFSVF